MILRKVRKFIFSFKKLYLSRRFRLLEHITSQNYKTIQKLVKNINNSSIFYNNYYCEGIKKSYLEPYTKTLLSKISEFENFEFEIINDILLIKSKRLVCKQDIEKAEELINTIS